MTTIIATGTAVGNVISQEDLYLEGAPYILFSGQSGYSAEQS